MATDAYMVFKDSKGAYLASESTVDLGSNDEPLGADFKSAGAGNIFEVKDYSFGYEQILNMSSQSTGIGAGKVTFNPFSITRAIDKSSPKMFQYMCAGMHFQDVFLGLRKAVGGETSGKFFMLFKFHLVGVKTLNWAHDEESPTESIEFEYGAIQLQYSQQDKKGALATPVPASWSRLTNTSTFPT